MDIDKHYLNGCEWVRSASKDRSTKVGAIIVGLDGELVSTGYNGFPRKINDNIDARHERPVKYDWTIHAENNAIYNAARIGSSTKNCTLYCSHTPCIHCLAAMIQAGISRIVVNKNNNFTSESKFYVNHFFEENKTFFEMLQESGVTFRVIE